uniref:Uncharacterized protein n=1 Tax=Arundo donax TaxID=35708 RepID=A0A0A9EFY8_ARUDO
MATRSSTRERTSSTSSRLPTSAVIGVAVPCARAARNPSPHSLPPHVARTPGSGRRETRGGVAGQGMGTHGRKLREEPPRSSAFRRRRSGRWFG